MAPHNIGTFPTPSVREDHFHVPLMFHANSQAESQDDAAKDTCNPEYLHHTESQSAQPLIASSAFVKRLLVDFMSVLVAIAFLGFVILGVKSKNKEIGHRETTLLNVARIVATGLPYCFALVFGRTIQTVLSSRMEKGIDCLSLAYLSRSQSLGGTLTAPLHIRLGHWLPLLLVAVWAFSPLGSQASLRFISLQTRATHSQLNSPAQYSYPQATFDSACSDCQAGAHNAMYLAAFLPIERTGRAFQDTWGNIKIPLLEYTNSTSSAGAWRKVNWQTDLQYSSLIGIPFSLPPGHGNMSFTMESWYWELESPTLWEAPSSQPLLLSKQEYNSSYLLTNVTGASRLWQFAIPESLERNTIFHAEDPLRFANISTPGIPIAFEVTTSDWMNNSLDVPYAYGNHYDIKKMVDATVRLEALLVQRPVELNVSCTVSSCNVTDIRTTNMPAEFSPTLNQIYFLTWFLNHFQDAFPLEHRGTSYSGALEAYLFDSSRNPYTLVDGSGGYVDLVGISAETLGRRLAQVMNAYWIVDNQYFNAVGGFNVSSRTWNGRKEYIRNSTVTVTNYQEYLHCDGLWAAVLLASSIMLLLAALASAVLSFFRLAPDCTDFLSALTLHDGRLMLEGGSSLDEYERVRLLKDVRLKVGDARSWEQVGQTIIAQDGHVGDLKKKRLYW